MMNHTYVIPRDSRDEVTVAVLIVQFTDAAIQQGYSNVNKLKSLIVEAVTNWVKNSPAGRMRGKNQATTSTSVTCRTSRKMS
jgi:hypothetical protein